MGVLKPVCRLGDQGTGTCYAHPSPTAFTTTFVSTPGTTVTVDGIVICTIGTIGTTTCGHHTQASTGSGESKDPLGNAFHRVGDVGFVIENTEGTYVATTGSGTTSSE